MSVSHGRDRYSSILTYLIGEGKVVKPRRVCLPADAAGGASSVNSAAPASAGKGKTKKKGGNERGKKRKAAEISAADDSASGDSEGGGDLFLIENFCSTVSSKAEWLKQAFAERVENLCENLDEEEEECVRTKPVYLGTLYHTSVPITTAIC